MRRILGLKKAIWVLLFFLLPSVMTEGVSRIKYAPDNGSFAIVKGTSSLHDWSVRTDQIEGYAEFKEAIGEITLGDVLTLSSDTEKPVVHVLIPAVSLKSEKKAMDNNMYSALKTDQYPQITFDLSAIAVTEIKDTAHLVIKATGSLNIAGVSRTFELPVMVDASRQSGIVFTGDTSLKMTDFQIKPPKAMLGMLKTGDEVKIEFKWVISPASKPEAVH